MSRTTAESLSDSSTGPPVDPSMLAVLNRLLDELRAQRDERQPALRAVQEYIGTDAACWLMTGAPPVVVGRIGLPDGGRKLVAEITAELAKTKAPQLRSPGPPVWAAVRVQEAPPAWVVAVRDGPGPEFRDDEVELMRLAGRMARQSRGAAQANTRLRDSLVGLVKSMTAMVDAKDACTAGHSERVARIAVCVAKRMRLPQKAVSDIYLAGLLHDVGKVGVRDAVLLKPDALTEEETLHLREHTVIGDRIVSNIPHFRNLRPGVRNHHERFDGKGYPDGLTGEDIPLMARVLAVADACDAMMSSRRYRAALPPPQIDALFFELAGSQFDPQVVNHFMLCRHEIYPPIYQQGIGESAYHAVASALETGTHESLALLRVKGVEKHFSYE